MLFRSILYYLETLEDMDVKTISLEGERIEISDFAKLHGDQSMYFEIGNGIICIKKKKCKLVKIFYVETNFAKRKNPILINRRQEQSIVIVYSHGLIIIHSLMSVPREFFNRPKLKPAFDGMNVRKIFLFGEEIKDFSALRNLDQTKIIPYQNGNDICFELNYSCAMHGIFFGEDVKCEKITIESFQIDFISNKNNETKKWETRIMNEPVKIDYVFIPNFIIIRGNKKMEMYYISGTCYGNVDTYKHICPILSEIEDHMTEHHNLEM